MQDGFLQPAFNKSKKLFHRKFLSCIYINSNPNSNPNLNP